MIVAESKVDYLDNVNFESLLQNKYGKENVKDNGTKYLVKKDGYNITFDKENKTIEIEQNNDENNKIEPFILYNSSNDGTSDFIGVNPKYSNITKVEQESSYYWTMDAEKMYAPYYGNKRLVFNEIIENKGYTTCHVDLKVPYGVNGTYNISDITFSKGIDISKITRFAESGQTGIFKTKYFTDYTDSKVPYTLERQVVDIDISDANGADFYVGLNNCDCDIYIYKIWFD